MANVFVNGTIFDVFNYYCDLVKNIGDMIRKCPEIADIKYLDLINEYVAEVKEKKEGS